MSRWQYRLRYTNLNWGDGGSGASWQDVRPSGLENLTAHSDLQFRRKPGRAASLVAAVFRRRRPS